VGASDVKILAVLGLWTGVHALLWTWAIGSLLAMAHAILVLYLKLHQFHARRGAISSLAIPATRDIPFVSYLAAGAAIALLADFTSDAEGFGAVS
jgi:prepilin peptidase CpaA